MQGSVFISYESYIFKFYNLSTGICSTKTNRKNKKEKVNLTKFHSS